MASPSAKIGWCPAFAAKIAHVRMGAIMSVEA